MQKLDQFQLGFRSLSENPLRTVLMVLTIVVGIASDILLINLVIGANDLVADKVYGLGADTFQVTKSPLLFTSLKEYMETLHRKNLTLQNYYEVLDTCAHCQFVGAVATRNDVTVAFNRQVVSNTEIRGWTAQVQDIYNLKLIEGRPFADLDMLHRGQVVILGYGLFSSLFASANPIDESIHIDGIKYRVIGVGQKEGSYLSKDRDNWAALPLSTWQARYGLHQPLMIWVKGTDGDANMEKAMDEVRTTLRRSRHQPAVGNDSFEINTNASVMSLWTNLSGAFSLTLIAITSLTVLAGGLMVMNTMLISVTERTTEIGLCRAVGARRSVIFQQFLAEALSLSLFGGLLGVAIGQGLWEGLSYLMLLPSPFTLWPIIISVGVSASAGVVFGIIPARKACLMDPVEALRSER